MLTGHNSKEDNLYFEPIVEEIHIDLLVVEEAGQMKLQMLKME